MSTKDIIQFSEATCHLSQDRGYRLDPLNLDISHALDTAPFLLISSARPLLAIPL